MKISKTVISKIGNHEIQKIKFLNNNNYSVEFYNFGGCFHSIKIPYKDNVSFTEDVLLGYRNIGCYQSDNIYLNAIIGRVSGRIANSQFVLNNKAYKLFSNDGSHHIHGGKKGFNKKIWTINQLYKENDSLTCVMTSSSKNMEEGYPGKLNCSTTYSLNNKNELIINFVVECEQDTIVSLTNHNYWNFHGHNSKYQQISDHSVKLKAQLYCESDKDLIPTGKLVNVQKAKFDFQRYKMIDKNVLDNNGIDACYCIDDFDGKIKKVASVYSNLTKMGLYLYSNQPGLQFYTGNMMNHCYLGKYKRQYGQNYGLCLEPQLFPDAINHKNFISPVLHKGQTYNSKIIMKLKNDF